MNETLAGGRYTIVRRLATGGMGEVLLAEFVGDAEITPGLLVVKRILSAAPGQPPAESQVRMLREEGRLGARLLHGNLVETLRTEENDGDPLLVIELLAGRSMAQVLGQAKKRKELVPIDVALAILRGACCGLHFAHTLKGPDGQSLGLVHRDVSPANIFVTFDGRVKVIDFGVAKSEDSEIKTATGILKGKLGYMSPEQSLGEGKLTKQADVWSLGVFFWEMLVAERLFSSPNPTATLFQISQKEIPRPSTLRADVPPAVEAICLRMLERPLQARFPSCADVVRAIDALPDAGGLSRVDIGGWLAGRFPEEAEAGRAEAARCARRKAAQPVPQGLVEGSTWDPAAADDDVATAILSADARDALLARASSDADDADATVRVDPQIVAELRRSARAPSVEADEDANRTRRVDPMAVAALRAEPSPVRRPPTSPSFPAPPSPPAPPRSATASGALPAASTTSGTIAPVASSVPPPPTPFAPTPAPMRAPTPAPMRAPTPAPMRAPTPAPMRAPMPTPMGAPPPTAGTVAPPPTALLPTPAAFPPPSAALAPAPAPSPKTTAPPIAAAAGARVSWLAVAIGTFGALVLAVGVGSSFFVSRPEPRVLYAWTDPAGFDVIVADPTHAPPGAPARAIDPTAPTLLRSGELEPRAVPSEVLKERLIAAGVWARASVPQTARARAAALLPVLIVGLGLLALAFAVPAFLPRASKTVTLVLRVALMLGALAFTGVVVQRGGLSWPGSKLLDSAPQLEWR